MTAYAKIPQPREGEPLSERCVWCWATLKVGFAHGGGSPVVTDRHSFICHSPKGKFPESHGWSEWMPAAKMHLAVFPRTQHWCADGICTSTPADLAAICADVVTEKEPRRTVPTCGINGCRVPNGAIHCGKCGNLGAFTIEGLEPDPERLRRVLLNPEASEAGRIVAGLLREIRGTA